MSHEELRLPPAVGSRTHLLSLPYDIRHTIYQHLFPSAQIIYLGATKDGLSHMMRPGELSMSIVSTCHQMYTEANVYFYNNYPINIIGYKKYCIEHYQPIYELGKRFAKHGSCLRALDNGELSTTACVSIHPRGGRVDAMMRRRKQGNPRDIDEVKREIAGMPEHGGLESEELPARCYARAVCLLAFVMGKLRMLCTPSGLAAVLVIATAVCIAWSQNREPSEGRQDT